MKSSGIVFDMARLFTQPVVTDALIDRSRYHFNGTAYNISAWERLPSGLYCPKMVSGSNSYYLVPDIAPLLGAKQATWMGWVRKDAYVQYQAIATDYTTTGGHKRWVLGYDNPDGTLNNTVGNGITLAATVCTGFTTGAWHFVWMRYTANSETGAETGIDNTVGTPVSTTSVLALGAGILNHTYIGRYTSYYSSITLATLRICNVALTDGQIYQYREATRKLIGV